MVITTEILACPALQPYVRCYTLREFDTGGADFIKPLPANHEFTIAFTLNGSLSTSTSSFGDSIAGARQHIIGLQTSYKGSVIFNGSVRLLTIQFKPNGFFRIFNIPMHLLTNNIFKLSDVLDKRMRVYNERLSEAKDLFTMKTTTDELLLSHLINNKEIDNHYSITSTSAIIFENYGNVNIKNLAYEANMSLKAFELKFTEQVGIPPKLYARLTRFNYALFVKMRNMSTSWTKICHECGYYDQMHFIKEFKQFAGNTPGGFYKSTPLPFEDYRKH